MFKLILSICIIYWPLFCFSNNFNDNRLSHICSTQESCSSCLQIPTCIWCSEIDNEDNGKVSSPCITASEYSEKWCSSKFVFNLTSTIEYIVNESFSTTKNGKSIQIHPQKIKLKLRKNEELRFVLKYTQIEDYPVDLYYLIDLSSSMYRYKDSLKTLGTDLTTAMKNLTSNFRLGFGSFVDKVVLPMTLTDKESLKAPCSGCAPPYAYKHQMSLTEDSSYFKKNVNNAPISGNLDTPEGGLDAMMQAIVCTDRIGWRPKAHHLLVYSSDASFHFAGDGRLAGIIEPNDLECHLDDDGSYSYSLLQDYPSISQINRKAFEHNINIIFAVPEKVETAYKYLSQSVKGSAVGIVEEYDTINVINLIKGEYEKLVESVELVDNVTRNINIQYFSKCIMDSGELKQRSKCDGIRFGDVVEFEVVIQMTECPKDRNSWQQTFEIKPRSINESLIVEIELVCECPCETPDNEGFKENAKECNGNGNLSCGICICNSGHHGKSCQCDGNDPQNNTVNELLCQAPNDTKLCSNHGTCKCGVCECEKRTNHWEIFSGRYCECNNFSCKRNRGLPCGNNGKCVCGKCECDPGFTGDSCQCPDISTCFPDSKDSLICNGHGDCICGVCHCHSQEDFYSGPYCHDCPTCDGLHCDELRDCVECDLFKSGIKFKDNDCQNCYLQNININEEIDKVEVTAEEFRKGMRSCQVTTSDGCKFGFKYTRITRGDIFSFEIISENKKSGCPKPVPVLPLVIGITVSTVIIGFLTLLIWKIVTTIHDRREYVKFEKERLMAQWHRQENPLYKQATSTFTNPTFCENRE